MTFPAPAGAPFEPGAFRAQMALGIAAHAAGDRVKALTAFESALALEPGNANAASACATLLFELARPQAAFRLLLSVEKLLLADADGAANLAIAASNCGQWDQARGYFEHALALDGDHVRALSHLGLLAAREGRWREATAHAQRCLSLAREHAWAWTQLADVLIGSRRHADAVAHLGEALRQFPDHAQLALRHAVALALNAEFEVAERALAALNPEASAALRQFLHESAARQTGHAAAPAPQARALFSRQAFEALEDCDWRDHDRLSTVLREQLAAVRPGGPGCDLRDAMFYGLALPLSEEDMVRAGQATWAALAAAPGKALPVFSGKRALRHDDDRIHVGIAARSLHEVPATQALAAQLALHDSARFVFHVYSPTPKPQAVLSAPLSPHRVVEIAHFTDEEAVRRIRLDPLDLWLDLGFGTPWWRPAIAQARVAAVQLQQPPWQRQLAPGPFDYTLSDIFVHPEASADGRGGALVRLPHCCWLAAQGPTPGQPAVTREDAGLPADALVLCAWVPLMRIDPDTFGVWMRLLRALPDAVLWLPACAPGAQAHLAREAQGAGVHAQRLVFARPAAYPDMLARLELADLFLDPLRFNADQSLADALRIGLPAITCAGRSMASRLGGSIVSSAGLPDCVVLDQAAYTAAVLALGRDRSRLAALRLRLQAAKTTAPLFDVPARVRELEAAWTFMAGRARAGLAPAALDVPAHWPSVATVSIAAHARI